MLRFVHQCQIKAVIRFFPHTAEIIIVLEGNDKIAFLIIDMICRQIQSQFFSKNRNQNLLRKCISRFRDRCQKCIHFCPFFIGLGKCPAVSGCRFFDRPAIGHCCSAILFVRHNILDQIHELYSRHITIRLFCRKLIDDIIIFGRIQDIAKQSCSREIAKLRIIEQFKIFVLTKIGNVCHSINVSNFLGIIKPCIEREDIRAIPIQI